MEVDAKMTAAAAFQAAGSCRSAPSARRLKPHPSGWGKAAKPAAGLFPRVCNFRLPLTRMGRFRFVEIETAEEPLQRIA